MKHIGIVSVAGLVLAVLISVGLSPPKPAGAAAAVPAPPTAAPATTTAPASTAPTTSTAPTMAPPTTAPTVTAPPTTAPPTTAPRPATSLPVRPQSPVTEPMAGPRVASAGQIGAQALSEITYPWAGLGYQIEFHGPRDGFLGLTDCTRRHIDIYVTPGQTAAQVEFATAFEIAHAVDCTRMTSQGQATWARRRGFQLTRAWFPPCSCSEANYASGDFAEVFARWQAGPAYPWMSRLAPAPIGSQLGALVILFQG